MQCDKELAGTGAEGQRVTGFWVANIENGTVTMFFCFFYGSLNREAKQCMWELYTTTVLASNVDSTLVRCVYTAGR